MSRTFKTNPILVKCFTQPGMIEENHDHTSGECDLPERPTRRTGLTGEQTMWGNATRCTWTPSRAFWDSPLSTCGCPTCGQRWWFQEERRKQRYSGRSEVREAYVDLAEHGISDGLGDVQPLVGTAEFKRNQFGGQVDEEYERGSALRDALELPNDCLIVDFNFAEPDFTACAGSDFKAAWDATEGFRMPDSFWVFASIELMYPDGAREWLALNRDGVAP